MKNIFRIVALMTASVMGGSMFAGEGLSKETVHALLIAEKLSGNSSKAKEAHVEKYELLNSMLDKGALDFMRKEVVSCLSIEYLKRISGEYKNISSEFMGERIEGEFFYRSHCPKKLYQNLNIHVMRKVCAIISAEESKEESKQ